MTRDQAFGHTRRDVLAAGGALVATAMLPRQPRAADPVKLRGRVLISDEGSAKHGAGLPGVMVSNGQDVVISDERGEWLLEPAPDGTIFVVKPSGWTYLDTCGVPRMALNASDQDVTGGSLDFHLRAQAEEETFEVALLADTQAANALELDYVRRELLRCQFSRDYAFAINHGDVMGDDLSLLGPYKEIVRNTGIVWHHCPGNHDMDLASSSGVHAFDTWKRNIGPGHYAFQYARTTFILLNNVDYRGAGATPVDGRLYTGRIGEGQLAFVRNVLAHVPKDNLVVLSMHIPLRSFENPHAPGDNTADCAALMELLSGFPHTVSFSGHSHTTEHHYLGREAGFTRAEPHHHHVLTAFCGSWWGGPLNARGIPIADSRDGSPRGYHVLRVEGHSYTTRFVALGDAGGAGARTFANDATIDEPACMHHGLTVDVFDGGPNTRIRCTLSESKQAFELQRTTMPDPHIIESYARHRALLKPWVSPAPSSHIWTGALPATASGDIIIEITDEYGRQRSLSIRV